MIVTLHDEGWQKPFLRLAWGPRRVTSKRRYGSIDGAYPPSFSVSHTLLLRWFWRGAKEWAKRDWRIVIPATKAEARIRQAIRDIDEPKPRAATFSEAEIAQMLKERQELRAAKDFAAADAIRDKLVAAGIQIADQKL